MKRHLFVPFSLLLVAFTSCNSNKGMEGKNTNSSGEIYVYLEESFKPLFETSIYTFEGQFPLATINADYVNEMEAIDAFINGKTATICITRDFTEEEKKSLLLSYSWQYMSKRNRMPTQN